MEAKEETPPVPGNYFWWPASYIWYGGVMGLWLGPGPIIREMLHKIPKPDYSSLPRHTSETVVLTGGTRGIGTEVLKKLLQLDFTVFIGARKVEDGLKAVQRLRDENGVSSGQVKCFPLDLKSLKSVKNFAKSILSNTDRVDLLINNAGVMFNPWEVTEDNMEVHFQVNYLSHFLLTQLLLPIMKETGKRRQSPCRIVNVSSLAHFGASRKYLQYVHYPKIYSPYKAYFESKLCQVVSTKTLDKKLQKESANIRVLSVHPGVIPTDLYNNLGLVGQGFKAVRKGFRSMEEGAEEIMFTATSPTLNNQGGCYIQNTKVEKASKEADYEDTQNLLWDISQDIIKPFINQ